MTTLKLVNTNPITLKAGERQKVSFNYVFMTTEPLLLSILYADCILFQYGLSYKPNIILCHKQYPWIWIYNHSPQTKYLKSGSILVYCTIINPGIMF